MTCEEFVLSRLQELEKENQGLKETQDVLNKCLMESNKKYVELEEKFNELKGVLLEHIELKTTSIGTKYVDFNTFWNRDFNKKERDDYEIVASILELKPEMFKPYVAPVIEETEEEEEEPSKEE